MPKARKFDIDFIAGLCILHMMWAHAMQISGLTEHVSYQIITTIASGYMAWFFFKSGMLCKETPLKPLIKKLSLKVLVPYAILSMTAIIFEVCYGLLSNQLIDGEPFSLSRLFLRLLAHTAPPLNLALWFLPCFFFVQILFAAFSAVFAPGPGFFQGLWMEGRKKRCPYRDSVSIMSSRVEKSPVAALGVRLRQGLRAPASLSGTDEAAASRALPAAVSRTSTFRPSASSRSLSTNPSVSIRFRSGVTVLVSR